MELTDEHMEAIKEAAREVDYGKVVIHVSATDNSLTIEIIKKVSLEKK